MKHVIDVDTKSNSGGDALKTHQTKHYEGKTMEREIAFIDRDVCHLEQLLSGLRRDVDPILLSSSKPALAQIADELQSREGVKHVHVIAHGQPGEVSYCR